VLAALLFASAGCSLPVPAHGELGPRPRRPRTAFVVIGDTQRSLWAEEHLLGREQNELDRPRLIDQLAREENPAFVVHLGDLVAAASPPHWRYFDELMKPLADAKIPILPVLGNHEYFGEGRDPSRSARRRHPELARGGHYAKRWGRLGLVWLDSNLTGRRATRQAEWLARTLTELEEAPGIAGTLVFIHHPPVTNGVDRSGHESVRDELLPVIRR
jgi:3',5'-cyclic AMP phosphodiesterase CpdA